MEHPHAARPGRTRAVRRLGLAALVLYVVAVVLLLVRVLAATGSIDRKVADIRTLSRSLDQSTGAVLELSRTNEVVRGIVDDVRPLSGRLDTTLTTAAEVSGLVRSVDATTREIDAIGAQIEGVVTSIDGSAASIAGSASSIDPQVGEIDLSLQTLLDLAASIGAGTHALRGTAQQIDVTANAIDCNLALVGVLIGAAHQDACNRAAGR